MLGPRPGCPGALRPAHATKVPRPSQSTSQRRNPGSQRTTRAGGTGLAWWIGPHVGPCHTAPHGACPPKHQPKHLAVAHTPQDLALQPLLGGFILGLAALAKYMVTGRVLGISGAVRG